MAAENNTSSNRRTKSTNPTEAQLHYESLTSAFKWMVGMGSTFLAFCIAVASYLTYNSMKDLRAEIKESKDEAKAELMNIRLEAEKTQLSIRSRMDGTIEDLTDNVNRTQNVATEQISGFKVLALNEAKAKVEEVFKTRNLEQLVESIAKSSLEAKMTDIADRTLTQNQKVMIDRAISDLNSKDEYTVERAYNILFANMTSEFDDEQIDAMISYIDHDASRTWSGSVASLLGAKRSPKISRYFQKSLKDSTSAGYVYALGNLIVVNRMEEIAVLEQYFIDKIDKRRAFGELINISVVNPKLVLKILNSRIMVDALYRLYPINVFNDMKVNTKKSTEAVLTKIDFDQSYFNMKR